MTETGKKKVKKTTRGRIISCPNCSKRRLVSFSKKLRNILFFPKKGRPQKSILWGTVSDDANSNFSSFSLSAFPGVPATS